MKKETRESKVTIKIPRPLYDNLKGIIEGTGFNSVTDFIVYVLRDIASGGRERVDGELSREEIELVRKRLKALGYL
jgi:hypothetical protein